MLDRYRQLLSCVNLTARCPIDVLLFLAVPRIDHESHSRDGQRRLCNIGSDNDPSCVGRFRLEDLLLGGLRQGSIERDDLKLSR
jgi:hypothetical protein